MRFGRPGVMVIQWLRIAVAMALFAVSTLVHVAVLLVAALLKALLRLPAAQARLNVLLLRISESWIGLNTAMIRALTRTRIVVECQGELSPQGHYLVLANHQSWVDIPILQAVFNRRIPLLRFFLKSQLFWVPVLGLAWWALDFPFMKRYSREQLARRPELAGRDRAATRRACAKFRGIPVSIMSFAEGTRFSTAKHRAQQSPHLYLLKPRAGGVAFVLDAMGDALHAILDVTIAYPNGQPTIAALFADRVPEVRVHVRRLEIPPQLKGAAHESSAMPAASGAAAGRPTATQGAAKSPVLAEPSHESDPARERAQAWINSLWAEKDAQLSTLLTMPKADRGDIPAGLAGG